MQEMLIKFVTKNIFQSMADGNKIKIIVFSFLGAFRTLTKGEAGGASGIFVDC